MTNDELKRKAEGYLTSFKDTGVEKSIHYFIIMELLKRVEELEYNLTEGENK